MTNENQMDRRQFTGNLVTGTGVVAAFLTSRLGCADDDRRPKEPKEVVKPEEAPERPARPSLEVILLTYLTQRYPSDHYDDAAVQGIYGDIRGDVARGRILSEFPLKNFDEPAFVFQAYRAPD